MDQKICPICGEDRLVERNDDFETNYIDRKGVERSLSLSNIARLRCESCNEEIFDDAATRQIEDARRTAIGLLSAREIRDLRLLLGKTQVQMSRLLGVGEKTYCRWESGSFVQSVASDNYLRLIRDVPQASLMLIHLEQYGPSETPYSQSEEQVEFSFLENVDTLTEAASKFTEQLVMGKLHACGV
jgi:putative zinc finger/helix-turn-helix YgiT family protein